MQRFLQLLFEYLWQGGDRQPDLARAPLENFLREQLLAI